MILPFIPEDSEIIDDIEPLMAGEKDPLIIVHSGAQSVPVGFMEKWSMTTELIMRQIPGVRCPTCLAAGKEVWVIPGKLCHECGTECG
jgi:hypothetical protein